MKTSSTTAQTWRLNLESSQNLPDLRLENGFRRNFILFGQSYHWDEWAEGEIEEQQLAGLRYGARWNQHGARQG